MSKHVPLRLEAYWHPNPAARWDAAAEAERNRAEFALTNALGDAQTRAFEAAHGLQWADADDDDTPPPFVESGFLRGLLWGVGLTASVLFVAAVVFLGRLLPR